MYSTDQRFEKIKEKAQNEDKLFENCQVTANNYNFPHIYLSDEEIQEFNEECRKAGLDLKVVPLYEYMNSNQDKLELNSSKKAKLLSDCFINIPNNEVEEEKKSSFMNDFSINFDSDVNKKGPEKKYLNKKRNKILNDSENSMEENKSIENRNNSNDDQSMSSFSITNSNKNRTEINKKKEKNKSKNPANNRKKTVTTVKMPKKRKNNFGKDNKEKKDKMDINNNMNNWFKRIKETSAECQNEEINKQKIIEEIMKRSENLTKDGLKEMANNKHIKLVGDQFKITDLKGKTLPQLKGILQDIKINSDIIMLDNDRKNVIKNIRNKEEMQRKSQERALKKKQKEEEKKRENLQKIEQQKQKEQQYREEDSESSYDEKDSLE